MMNFPRRFLPMALAVAVAACDSGSPSPTATTEAVPVAAAATHQPEEAKDESHAPDAALVAALAPRFGEFGDVRVFHAQADLDGDGRAETLAYVAGPMVCGTGGCPLLLLARSGAGYEVLAELSVVRPPVRVASGSTHGWRDLIVGVGGGGLPAGDALLRHDGSGYPSNPTVPPAEPVTDTGEATVLIAEFGSYTEGLPLNTAEVKP